MRAIPCLVIIGMSLSAGLTAQPALPGASVAAQPGFCDHHGKAPWAFVELGPQGRRTKKVTREHIGPIVVSLAVPAAVTWDAQSTNHFFHHCPAGYKPAEADPVMRPFAGKLLMYPMANLVFAAPIDLALYKTRHSQKSIRILSYAAASAWAGLEVNQSIVNMRNEHPTRR